ncbi:MAG TPA: YwiC-like family protein [Anaerolineae bacterium]|nr:YwiC-like family protein [Anaerolineae bacterium]HID84184.1 hypothetical protein [Anaerolineales bacterium]HIQ09120.1 hypothetical protein [Anaerolineaceae bacterium]
MRDFRKHRLVALPQEHGAWTFLLSPLFIGLFAGKHWTPDIGYLLLGLLAAFFMRQPVAMVVKVLSGRRPREYLPYGLLWSAVYGIIGLAALVVLLQQGHVYLLWLLPPGILVFAWHLMLVARRNERRQIGVEIVASGVLALAAPAAYWMPYNGPQPAGWLLWLLAWLQSAASIVFVYLRLEQRSWAEVPPLEERFNAGHRALMYAGFNVVLALVLGLSRSIPPWVWLAYLVQFAEVLWGTWHPAVKWRPSRIGIRQMVVSTLFTLVFILTWRMG